MKYCIFIFIALCKTLVFAQINDSVGLFYSKQIKNTSLKENLTVLASDSFYGRGNGQRGVNLAAEFIKTSFSNSGIPPLKNTNSYFQEYNISLIKRKIIGFEINSQKYFQDKDFIENQSSSINFDTTFSEFSFLGYGIKSELYNDYANKNVAHQCVLILDGYPSITNNKDTTLKNWNTTRKIKEANRLGVALLLIVKDDLKPNEYEWITRAKLSENNSYKAENVFTALYISKKMADQLLSGTEQTLSTLKAQVAKDALPYSITYSKKIKFEVKQMIEETTAKNVLGFIEGSDLKDELIIISSHYDHLGVRNGVIYNGADDDGSGTVAVLELAKVFAQAKSEGYCPRRSLLFLTFSGEEVGLLGSTAYVNSPIFPLKNTICNLNIDMIGRIDTVHKNNSNYVYLIGSDRLSKDLHKISELTNEKNTKLELDYTYNQLNDPKRYFFRSDHYNFAKNNIPIIFYFNGEHLDYHQPSDDIDKIDFEVLKLRTQLVFLTAWEIANRIEKIKIN